MSKNIKDVKDVEPTSCIEQIKKTERFDKRWDNCKRNNK